MYKTLRIASGFLQGYKDPSRKKGISIPNTVEWKWLTEVISRSNYLWSFNVLLSGIPVRSKKHWKLVTTVPFKHLFFWNPWYFNPLKHQLRWLGSSLTSGRRDLRIRITSRHWHSILTTETHCIYTTIPLVGQENNHNILGVFPSN